MTRRILLPMATLAALAGPQALAQDQPGRGWYVEAFGGASQLQGDDLSFSGALSGSSKASYSTGFIAGGAIGFAYNPNLAAEIEYAYRTGDADDLRRSLARSGDFASTAVMINGIYTFDGWANGVKPYLGAGIGLATEIDFDLEDGGNAGEFSDEWIFAAQGMAGLAYDFAEDWRVSGEIRYFDAGTPTLSGDDGARLEARYNTLDFVVGLSYRF